MSEQLQLRRGTGVQVAANTPAAGEVWVNTDASRLVVGDGSTVGGFAVPKMSEVASYAFVAKAISANLVADTQLFVPLPPGVTRYRVTRVTALAPSVSLTAAQAAVYNAASGGGVAICSPQALSGLTLYFRITTPQGAAATVDVILHIQPYD
jgi:hypothetical protein